MSRRYIVEHHDAALKPVVSVDYDLPENALAALAGGLSGAGHDTDAVHKALRTWTAVLMKGGTGATFTDPDLRGSVTIRITT